jgi:hypothetical protein
MRSPLRTVGAVMIGLVCAAILDAGTAQADVLDAAQLATEMRHSAILREEIRHAGYPDLVQRLHGPTAWPWKPEVLRLFYLERRKEIALSRAYLLDTPQLSFVRYRRSMSDELAEEVSRYLATAPPAYSDMGPAERADLAAQRAETAAARAESGAITAEHAAQRLDAVVTKMEGSLERQLQKK